MEFYIHSLRLGEKFVTEKVAADKLRFLSHDCKLKFSQTFSLALHSTGRNVVFNKTIAGR